MEKLYKHFPFGILCYFFKLLPNYDLQWVIIKREDWLSPKVRLDFPCLEAIDESEDLFLTLNIAHEFVFIRASRVFKRLDNSNAGEISLGNPHKFKHVAACVTSPVRPSELDGTHVPPSSIQIGSLGDDIVVEQHYGGIMLEPDQIYGFLVELENEILDCVLSCKFQ